ncbi:MAG TPA: hypothetical protein VJP07_10205 [Dehalococcoidia bacterium]|nr:hypothetical protein [Dehalococcoidia bacterium]
MQSLKIKRGEIVVSFTEDELAMVNQALNEIANGVHISEAEFQTRVGFTREEVRELLAKVHALLG